MIPVRPPIRNWQQEAEREQHRRGEADRPPAHRRDQVEVLDPGRDRERGRGQREVLGWRTGAGREHVVAPDAHRERREERAARRPSAGSRRSGGREKVATTSADRADEGEEHHVDDRVAVEPEEVLVGDRPGGAGEDADAWRSASEQRHRHDQHRERGHHHQAGDQHRPAEHRHPQHRHPRRPQPEDRGQHRQRDAAAIAERGEHDADHPEVQPDPRRGWRSDSGERRSIRRRAGAVRRSGSPGTSSARRRA